MYYLPLKLVSSLSPLTSRTSLLLFLSLILVLTYNPPKTLATFFPPHNASTVVYISHSHIAVFSDEKGPIVTTRRPG
jgi:hypothetical protein